MVEFYRFRFEDSRDCFESGRAIVYLCPLIWLLQNKGGLTIYGDELFGPYQYTENGIIYGGVIEDAQISLVLIVLDHKNIPTMVYLMKEMAELMDYSQLYLVLYLFECCDQLSMVELIKEMTELMEED